MENVNKNLSYSYSHTLSCLKSYSTWRDCFLNTWRYISSLKSRANIYVSTRVTISSVFSMYCTEYISQRVVKQFGKWKNYRPSQIINKFFSSLVSSMLRRNIGASAWLKRLIGEGAPDSVRADVRAILESERSPPSDKFTFKTHFYSTTKIVEVGFEWFGNGPWWGKGCRFGTPRHLGFMLRCTYLC